MEAFECFLDYFHKFHLEFLKTSENPEENCNNQCLSHSIFGFRTSTIGKCCENFLEPGEQFSLSIVGQDFLRTMKNFGEQADLNTIINANLENDCSYKRYLNCSCGEKYLATKFLSSFPKILAISIQWEENNMENSHSLLKIIDNSIDIMKILPTTESLDTLLYTFTGMLCFSKFFKHYIAIFFDPTTQKWNLFNDSSVNSFKSWKMLRFGLKLFSITPVLMFFTQNNLKKSSN